jgi:hypothetical protein
VLVVAAGRLVSAAHPGAKRAQPALPPSGHTWSLGRRTVRQFERANESGREYRDLLGANFAARWGKTAAERRVGLTADLDALGIFTKEI